MTTFTVVPQGMLPGVGDDAWHWNEATETLTINGTAFDISSVENGGTASVGVLATATRGAGALSIVAIVGFDTRTVSVAPDEAYTVEMTEAGDLPDQLVRVALPDGAEPWPARDVSGETLTITSAADVASTALTAERARMRAFKRAFNLALADADPMGSLTSAYPSAANMLELVEAYVADPAADAAVVQARADVTEYIRTHVDVEGIRLVFGLTDTEVDDLFRAARALA